MKRLFYLLLLISLVACENEDEVPEPTLQTITVTPVKTAKYRNVYRYFFRYQ